LQPIIRPVEQNDLAELQHFVVLAFEPIFASFQAILGPAIYNVLYPKDWQTLQRDLVASLCSNEKMLVWVAEVDSKLVGFIAYHLNHESKIGEVELLFVHPDYHNDGIGTLLNNFALTKLQEAGMLVAEVGTGGDDSHAPARRSYEKAGYTALPLVRYFKQLG